MTIRRTEDIHIQLLPLDPVSPAPLNIPSFVGLIPVAKLAFEFHNFHRLTKDALVVDVLDAEPEACWEGADQDVEVKEEGDPGGGLVLRYRGDDGNVDLSVADEDKRS